VLSRDKNIVTELNSLVCSNGNETVELTAISLKCFFSKWFYKATELPAEGEEDVIGKSQVLQAGPSFLCLLSFLSDLHGI